MAGCPGTWVHMTVEKGSSSKAWAITLLQCRGNTACALPETFESTVPRRVRSATFEPRPVGSPSRVVRSLSDSVMAHGLVG